MHRSDAQEQSYVTTPPHFAVCHRPDPPGGHRNPLRPGDSGGSALDSREIHLITTAEGARRARLALLSDDPGWFHRLRSDHHLPPIAFDDTCIHVPCAAQGHPLDDIRTPADNEAMADFIAETVRKLTADPASEVHASIAGGRKTMGFYLGYALSLYGRPQDRLSHVLVSEPFESSWDFFYPSPTSRIIPLPNKNLADTRDAQITLASIPFVRLRDGLPEDLLAGRSSFAATVAAARIALEPPALQLDLARRTILASGKVVSLPPVPLALLAVFARRAQQGLPPLSAPNKEVPDFDWGERFLHEYRLVRGPMDDLEQTEKALKNGMDGGYFSAHLSKLRRVLNKNLGPAATPYLIADSATRPRRYRLALPPEAITFAPLPDGKLAKSDSPAPLDDTGA